MILPSPSGSRLRQAEAFWTRLAAVGWLCEYMAHLRYIWLKKFGRSRAPRTRRCENACQRARRCPLMAATAAWALWTTAEHVGSMARPTTDDNITVYDDDVFCDSEKH